MREGDEKEERDGRVGERKWWSRRVPITLLHWVVSDRIGISPPLGLVSPFVFVVSVAIPTSDYLAIRGEGTWHLGWPAVFVFAGLNFLPKVLACMVANVFGSELRKYPIL